MWILNVSKSVSWPSACQVDFPAQGGVGQTRGLLMLGNTSLELSLGPKKSPSSHLAALHSWLPSAWHHSTLSL